MSGQIERFIQGLPRRRHRIRELVETDEGFASLTREYDAAAHEGENVSPGTKAEKSRRRRGAIERDIVAQIESSARLL